MQADKLPRVFTVDALWVVRQIHDNSIYEIYTDQALADALAGARNASADFHNAGVDALQDRLALHEINERKIPYWEVKTLKAAIAAACDEAADNNR